MSRGRRQRHPEPHNHHSSGWHALCTPSPSPSGQVTLLSRVRYILPPRGSTITNPTEDREPRVLKEIVASGTAGLWGAGVGTQAGRLQTPDSPTPHYFVCCDCGRETLSAAPRAPAVSTPARGPGTPRGESALGARQAPRAWVRAGPGAARSRSLRGAAEGGGALLDQQVACRGGRARRFGAESSITRGGEGLSPGLPEPGALAPHHSRAAGSPGRPVPPSPEPCSFRARTGGSPVRRRAGPGRGGAAASGGWLPAPRRLSPGPGRNEGPPPRPLDGPRRALKACPAAARGAETCTPQSRQPARAVPWRVSVPRPTLRAPRPPVVALSLALLPRWDAVRTPSVAPSAGRG